MCVYVCVCVCVCLCVCLCVCVCVYACMQLMIGIGCVALITHYWLGLHANYCWIGCHVNLGASCLMECMYVVTIILFLIGAQHSRVL